MYLPEGLNTGTPFFCGNILREMRVRPKRRSHEAQTAKLDTNEQSPTSVCVILSNVKCLIRVGVPKICAGRAHTAPLSFCFFERRGCPSGSLKHCPSK